MAIDFSKLSKITPEQMADDEARRDREMVEQELNGRYNLPTARRQIVLSEYPEIRHSLSGDRVAILRGEGTDGKDFYGILKSMPDEEFTFVDRVASLNKGSTIDVEFHDKARNWKDRSGKWRETTEQIIDVVRGPEALKYKIPEGVIEPQSKLELANLQAQRALQGMMR